MIRIKRHGIGTTHKKHCRQATATDVLTHIYLHTYEFLVAIFILYFIPIIDNLGERGDCLATLSRFYLVLINLFSLVLYFVKIFFFFQDSDSEGSISSSVRSSISSR